MSAAPQPNNTDVTVRNDAAKDGAPKSALPKLLLAFTALNIVIIGGGIAGAYFFFMKQAPQAAAQEKPKAEGGDHGAPETAPAGAEAAAEPEHAAEKGAEGEKASVQPLPMFKVDNVTVRLRNLEVDRYARATFEFETTASANIAKLQNSQPKMRDAILTLLADRAYEDLAGSAGMSKLKADIMERVVQIIGEKQLSGVYVSEFILQ